MTATLQSVFFIGNLLRSKKKDNHMEQDKSSLVTVNSWELLRQAHSWHKTGIQTRVALGETNKDVMFSGLLYPVIMLFTVELVWPWTVVQKQAKGLNFGIRRQLVVEMAVWQTFYLPDIALIALVFYICRFHTHILLTLTYIVCIAWKWHHWCLHFKTVIMDDLIGS